MTVIEALFHLSYVGEGGFFISEKERDLLFVTRSHVSRNQKIEHKINKY